MASPKSTRRILIVASLALVVGCGGRRSPAEERAHLAANSDGDIVIAAVWPWEARDELLYAQGLEMALDEVNAAGGVQGRSIRLLTVDDRQSVNEGRLVAQQLAETPEVMAVVGHLQSYVTVPAAAIYDLAGLVLVSPAATAGELTSKGYERVFRATLTDKAIGKQIAEFALRRGYRRVAIYYVRNDYGRSLANAFEERSYGSEISVVARHSYDPDQELTERILEPVLLEWHQMDLDAVFLAGEVPGAARVIAAIRASGIDVPILGPDAMSSPSLISVGGGSVEGTVVTSFFHAGEPRPEVLSFTRAFRERYDRDPDPASALGYDAIRLLAHAMKLAGTPDPQEVARVLHELDDWGGVTGGFTFDERGDLMGRRAVYVVVEDGRFAFLGETVPSREALTAGAGR